MTKQEAAEVLRQATEVFTNSYGPTTIRPYDYWARVEKIVDGDTIDMSISLGFSLSAIHRFRLIGIDTPEIFGVTKKSSEYKKGKKSLIYLEGIIPQGTWVEVRVFNGKREKFGRWLCEIYIDGTSVNQQLLIEGLAEPLLY